MMAGEEEASKASDKPTVSEDEHNVPSLASGGGGAVAASSSVKSLLSRITSSLDQLEKDYRRQLQETQANLGALQREKEGLEQDKRVLKQERGQAFKHLLTMCLEDKKSPKDAQDPQRETAQSKLDNVQLRLDECQKKLDPYLQQEREQSKQLQEISKLQTQIREDLSSAQSVEAQIGILTSSMSSMTRRLRGSRLAATRAQAVATSKEFSDFCRKSMSVDAPELKQLAEEMQKLEPFTQHKLTK